MLISLAIMTAFVPGSLGAASNTAWAVMWLAMPLLLLNCKIEMTLIHTLGLIFLSYAAISLLWSPHGLLELMQLLALASVFVWGYTLKDLRSVTIGLSLGLVISSIVAILQYFQVDMPILNFSKVSGLFINPNIYAEISGMILILILVYRLWWFIPVTIPGLMVCSRAVAIALGVSLAMFVWSKSKLLSVFIVISSWIVALNLSEFTLKTDGAPSVVANISSINVRIDAWIDMLAGFNVWGNGIGSFIYKFPDYNKHLDTSVSLAEYAHNDFLQLIFELGVGVVPLIFIIIDLLKVDNEHKQALVFFIIIGFFGFPLHMPATAFIFALVAAQLAKLSMVDRAIINRRRLPILRGMEAA